MKNMRNVSNAMKTIGMLLIVYWNITNKVNGLNIGGLGLLLLLASWYVLDYHYFAINQRANNA